jgi:hypothetical protein
MQPGVGCHLRQPNVDDLGSTAHRIKFGRLGLDETFASRYAENDAPSPGLLWTLNAPPLCSRSRRALHATQSCVAVRGGIAVNCAFACSVDRVGAGYASPECRSGPKERSAAADSGKSRIAPSCSN